MVHIRVIVCISTNQIPSKIGSTSRLVYLVFSRHLTLAMGVECLHTNIGSKHVFVNNKK
jgi:hypothetical protein